MTTRPFPTIPGIAFIGIIELFLFFQNPGHFFQGDTLYWLSNRYKGLGDFFAGFAGIDPGGWYRPLSQRTVESVLLPIVHMNPVPYHVITFCLFYLCTIAVFVLIDRITEKRRAAWFGTLFFATHVTHAYTTYDVAFTPELLYTMFYVCAVIFYVGYLRHERKPDLVASCAFLVGALFSKEAAITLPITLLAVWAFFDRRRVTVKSLAPHFGILLLYVIFAVGYIHVGGLEFRKLIESPTRAGLTGYELAIGSNVLQSLRTAVQWAFNFPGGQHGQWLLPDRWMFQFLQIFRATAFAAALFTLFTSSRKIVILGGFWFLIVTLPMLPLLDHFLPYYLLGPLVGLSLVIGCALEESYARVSTFAPSFALAFVAVLFAVLANINAVAIWDAVEHQPLLGEAANSALNSVDDLRALYPRLPKGAKLVFLNEESPGIWWNHAQGGLFQIAYDDSEITAEYSSLGITPGTGQSGLDKVFFLDVRKGRISPHAPYHVKLSQSVVRAGLDSYSLRIPELENVDVEVLYAINGMLMQPFKVRLDQQGEIEFKVDKSTRVGTYTIVGIRRVDDVAWVKPDASVEVKAR